MCHPTPRSRLLPVFGLLIPLIAGARLAAQSLPASAAHPVRELALVTAKMYVGPEISSSVIAMVRPGQEVAVLGYSGKFAHVFVHASGWMRNQGLLALNNPQATQILMGAARAREKRAERYALQGQTARNAALLYYRVWDDFRASPPAAEALYRAGAIAWQLERGEYNTPQGKYNYMLKGRLLRKVRGNYSHTPWAARAAYLLLQRKLNCNHWSRHPHCIVKEGHVYRDYYQNYKTGPRAAAAAYQTAWHYAVAVTAYSRPGRRQKLNRANHYRRKAEKWIRRIETLYPGSDWAGEAAFLNFRLSQQMPVGLKHL